MDLRGPPQYSIEFRVLHLFSFLLRLITSYLFPGLAATPNSPQQDQLLSSFLY